MIDLIRVSVSERGSIALEANIWIAVAIAILVLFAAVLVRWLRDLMFRQNYEIDKIELGVGSGKVTIKPNHDVLQIAYRLWVELKTRKLGLLFEEENDVITEVYSSWYEFFKVTRELIKSVPVASIRRDKDTQLLVNLSIDVLNKAIRPHLTKWQARYRHWTDVELSKQGVRDIPPQELQKRYPNYQELVRELKSTNLKLVAYARILSEILQLGAASGQRKPAN